jgi:hypothetical protein
MKDAVARTYTAKEYKVLALRECLVPESMLICDTPDTAAAYWRLHVTTNPYFNSEAECFVVLLLNTRKWVKGRLSALTLLLRP